LPAGVWLDRVRSRRRLMIGADLGRAALIGSIPLAFALGALAMPQLYVVGFLSGSLAVLFDLSWNTLFVSVTARDRYVEASALLNGSRSLASVGGPTIGGLLVQVIGAPLALLADAASFLGSVVFLRRIRASEPPIVADEDSIRDRLLAGLSFVLGDRLMRPTLLSVATVNLFTFASSALLILYVTTLLGVSPGLLGLALGTGAVGAVIGAIFASRIGRRLGMGPAYALGLIIFPASMLLIPLAGPGMPMPLILTLLFASEFGAGFGVMILDVNVGAIITARTPDRIRARAGGAFRFINYGVRPIGALLGGLLGEALGVREAILVSTIAATGGVLFLVGSPVLGLRELPEASE
jgi:77 Permeases of the major facilitator superfamily